MAKKRTKAKSKKNEFNSTPFSDLKGFAVSGAEKKEPEMPEQKRVSDNVIGFFADEMEMLGVKKLSDDVESDSELSAEPTVILPPSDSEKVTEEEIFLTAMGELSVNFRDGLPAKDSPPEAQQRRLKQLKRGKLSPEASLDLHGFRCTDVVRKLIHFLDDSLYQGLQTVLIITGKGMHSEDGTSVLRHEVEQFLSSEGKKYVIEWVRAPKQYGGEGAMVLFLRKIKGM